MRGNRRTPGVVLLTTIAAMLIAPSAAVANGGAYLEFDRTYYVPGDPGHAETYVSIPANKEHLLDEGPFYVFALPGGATLEEGRPIPPGAVRLGTVSVIAEDDTEEHDAYELSAEFMVPDVDPGGYDIGVCNDPCTISGFREPLSGWFMVVETRREAELLTVRDRLRVQLYGARREARRAERRLAAVQDDLDAQLAFATSDRTELVAEIQRLETQLATARAQTANEGRTPFDPWLVGAILLVTLVVAVLAFRRRRMLPAMTDL